ncbi:MAG: hypothetical protein M1297_07380 [Nitrospirae bacterium]|jgi:hypothetical protein|nr:hypothetical protein [Nitrospirota bacterium]
MPSLPSSPGEHPVRQEPIPRKWKGKGRLVLTGFFFLALTVLSFRPGHSFLPPVVPVVGDGWPVVPQKTLDAWVEKAPEGTFLSASDLQGWMGRHPWVREVSAKTFPWGARTISIRLKEPLAVLRSSSGILPSGTDLPSESPLFVPYLLPDGKVLTGRVVPAVTRMPEVIVRSPLGRSGGKRLVDTIRLVRSCRSSGAPSGQLFVFRKPHEIRFFPDRSSVYLVLPEEASCKPFQLYSRLVGQSSVLPATVTPVGYDLRFRGMVLVRPGGSATSEDKSRKVSPAR